MNFSFRIENSDEAAFIDYWSQKYFYASENLYTGNMGKPLTERSRRELFEWKNGGRISALKTASIKRNYPLEPPSDPENRFLSPQKGGGPIWNIFYLHIIDPERWPIYDQHAHRAMIYLQTGRIGEIPTRESEVYEAYRNLYIPFFNSLSESSGRMKDMALFSFGQFLKKASSYL